MNAPDWLVLIDDGLTARLQRCTVCGWQEARGPGLLCGAVRRSRWHGWSVARAGLLIPSASQ